MLDKDALSAARQAFDSSDMGHEYRLKAAIAAYLSSATADVGGLVAELRAFAGNGLMDRATATLTALAADKARLEGEVERLKAFDQANIEHIAAQRKWIDALREALANMIGHAKWAAAEFNVHYTFLAECEAALSAPKGGAHE